MRGYSQCYNHRPDLAYERRRNARKGGRTGGRGRPAAGTEARDVQGQSHTVIYWVLAGKVAKGAGSVAIQGYNALLRALETERRAFEQDELLGRLEALERVADRGEAEEASPWG